MKALAVALLSALLITAGLAWGFVHHFDTRVGMPPAPTPSAAAPKPAPATTAEWPQWRGPARDGVSRETGLLPVWLPGWPRVVWRVAGGSGYSSPCVAGGRVYTMVGRGGAELVVCLDASGGRELWAVRADAERTYEFGSGPQSTPIVEGGRVWALGASGTLLCLNASDGSEHWRIDLLKRFPAPNMRYGFAHSPVIEGDRLLVNAGAPGASVVALDKRTGAVLWKALDDRAGYASPIVITVDGLRQAVFFTSAAVVGLDVRDGRELWRVPWVTFDDCNVATPIWSEPDRLLFVSSAHGHGCAALRLSVAGGKASVETVWENKEMKNRISTCVLDGGRLYGFDGESVGKLKCLDLKTGAVLWADRSVGMGSLVMADGKRILLGVKGELALAAADADGCREISRCRPLTGKCWTAPVVAGGRLYLRNETEIVCLDIRRGGE